MDREDFRTLHELLVKECPIHGVSVGAFDDKTTWVIHFKEEATEEQRAAAQNVIEALDPNGPELTAETMFDEALHAGVTVEWNNSPELNGVYGVTPDLQLHAINEQTQIAAKGKFSTGQSQRLWPDINGELQQFSTSQFAPFAEAVAKYVSDLEYARGGAKRGMTTRAWPARTIRITL